jgi:uncharacterized protein
MRSSAIPSDPRSPFVFDLRELGRRPGAMKTLHRNVVLDGELGTDVIAIPRGADIQVDLTVESVLEGVFVSGTVRGRARGECVRCLDDVSISVLAEFQELFVYPDRVDGGEDDDQRVIEDETVDLDPTVTDAVVLALPFQPVCRDDCPGLCSVCGARLVDDPDHAHESVDPRWAALEGLMTDDGREEDPVPAAVQDMRARSEDGGTPEGPAGD